jgi:RimJ/RimL family protein N-acetyltransferase
MIRPMNRDDLEWVRRERNRPECRKWFRQNHDITQEEQSDWFDSTDMKNFIVEDFFGVKIGVVSLSHLDYTARKCEFSIMIVPERRGSGEGKKALWELLGHCFNDLNMLQVYSDVFYGNPALNNYIHWGFHIYGILPKWYYKDGRYIDSVVISITKDEYNNSLK